MIMVAGCTTLAASRYVTLPELLVVSLIALVDGPVLALDVLGPVTAVLFEELGPVTATAPLLDFDALEAEFLLTLELFELCFWP